MCSNQTHFRAIMVQSLSPLWQVCGVRVSQQVLFKIRPSPLWFTHVSLLPPALVTTVYICKMTESYGTSHSLIVWTQEVNWSYRGQTHKAVLAVGWRGMRKCMCVCTGYVCGGGGGEAVGGTSSYSSAVEEFPWAPLPGATVWPEQAEPAPVSPTWRRYTLSHSWSQELLQLLPFRSPGKRSWAECSNKREKRRQQKKSWRKEDEGKTEVKFKRREKREGPETADEMTGTDAGIRTDDLSAVTYKPWMSAVGGQWQSDANSAERTVNKKIESRLIWGKLNRSEGQNHVSKDAFLSSATDSCQFFQARWDTLPSKTISPGLSPGNYTFWTLRDWATVAGEMIHNTLKSTQPSEHSPRSTHSAAQRKLWRYSGCRRAGQVESHRRSVCVLAADLNAGGGGGGGGGGGVMHTIHGLCHLCIGCRLPQVCLCYRE